VPTAFGLRYPGWLGLSPLVSRLIVGCGRVQQGPDDLVSDGLAADQQRGHLGQHLDAVFVPGGIAVAAAAFPGVFG
jgi:hypothetical protein